MEAREKIERAERKLADLESAGEVREELYSGLRFLEKPLLDFLNELSPEALARLCRAVFQHFIIQTSGVARLMRAEIVAYEPTPMIKQALVDSFHNERLSPVVDMVYWIMNSLKPNDVPSAVRAESDVLKACLTT